MIDVFSSSIGSILDFMISMNDGIESCFISDVGVTSSQRGMKNLNLKVRNMTRKGSFNPYPESVELSHTPENYIVSYHGMKSLFFHLLMFGILVLDYLY